MKRLAIILLPVLIFAAQWMNTYPEAVKASDITVTEGGFVLSGTSREDGDSDGLIMKIDAAGNPLWQKDYGDIFSDAFLDIEMADDGGFYVFGGTQRSMGTDAAFWLLRTDSDGDSIWGRTYGDPTGYIPAAMDIDRDGNIVMVGSKAVLHDTTWAFNYVLLKVNPDGEPLWTETFGTSDELIATSVTAKGAIIIVAGQRLSDMSTHAMAVSHSGIEIWQRTYPGTCANDVITVADGGYLLVGHGTDYTLTSAAILIRIDDHGDTIWVRGHGGRNHIDGDHAVANSVCQLPDGGFAICGIYNEMYDWTYHNDALLMKVSSEGELRWLRHIGDLGNQTASTIVPDGECMMLTGLDDRGAIVIRTNRSGLVAPSDGLENRYLAGYVRDGTTGYPIAGAYVELYDVIGGAYPVLMDTTDIYGSFFFDPGDGIYYVHVPKLGFHDPWFYPGTNHPLEADPVTIDSTSPPTTWFDINLLQPSITGLQRVTGHVRTIDFDAIDRSHVIAISSDEVEDDESIVSGRTDSTGYYALDLSPGTWYIYAYTDGFIPGFFGDAWLWEDAEPIVVSTSGIIDVDMDLNFEDTTRGENAVEFIVRFYDDFPDTAGVPVHGCRIYLTDEISRPLRSGVTDEHGRARIENVPDGEYLLYADKVGYAMLDDPEFISITDDTLIEVQIDLIRPLEDVEEPRYARRQAEPTYIDIYPNPVRDRAEIEFSTPGGMTELYITDISGRRVLSESIGFLPPGRHTSTIDTGGLPSGVYMASTVCNGVVTSSRSMLLKR